MTLSNIINEKTLVPLSVVILLGGMLFPAVLWMNNNAKNQQMFNTQILTKMDGLNEKLELAASDRYTKTAAAEKAGRDALLNPEIIVSDPRNPDKVMPNAAGIAYMRGLGTNRP